MSSTFDRLKRGLGRKAQSQEKDQAKSRDATTQDPRTAVHVDVMHTRSWSISGDGGLVVSGQSVAMQRQPTRDLNSGLRQLNLSNPANGKFVNFATPENTEFYSQNPYFPLDSSRRVLRDYGNMSSVTVLFVLQEVLRGEPRGPALLSAMGPGFSAEHLLGEFV